MKRLLYCLVLFSLLPTIVWCAEPSVDQIYPWNVGGQNYCLVGSCGEGLTQFDRGILQKMAKTAIKQRVLDVLCKRLAILPSFVAGFGAAKLAELHGNPSAIIPLMIVAGFGGYKIGKYVASWCYRARQRAINQERNANLTYAQQMIGEHGQEMALGRLYMPYVQRQESINERARSCRGIFGKQAFEEYLRYGKFGLSVAVGLTRDEILHNKEGDLGLWPTQEYKANIYNNRCSFSGQQAVIDNILEQVAECEGKKFDRWPRLSYLWHVWIIPFFTIH